MAYRRAFAKVSFILLSLYQISARAQSQTEASPGLLQDLKQSAIEKNQAISGRITGWAERLDLYLAGGRRWTEKVNKTALRVSFFGHQTEGEDAEGSIDIDLNLRLPNLEERWDIVFTSHEDEEFESLDRRRPGSARGARQYGAGLGFFKRLGDLDATFRPGLKLKDPVETSYVLTLTRKDELKGFMIVPTFRFFADSERGTGQFAALRFDYKLNNHWVLRFLNEEQYLDLGNIYSTLHGPEVLYKESEKIGYSASFTSFSDNQPKFHLVHYRLHFSRRQELYKDILYFQVSPSWVFERDRDFHPRFDLAMNLDVIF